MKKHLSLKLFIAVISISLYSYLVIKNGKSLNAETTAPQPAQTSLSSQAPQAPSEASVAN